MVKLILSNVSDVSPSASRPGLPDTKVLTRQRKDRDLSNRSQGSPESGGWCFRLFNRGLSTVDFRPSDSHEPQTVYSQHHPPHTSVCLRGGSFRRPVPDTNSDPSPSPPSASPLFRPAVRGSLPVSVTPSTLAPVGVTSVPGMLRCRSFRQVLRGTRCKIVLHLHPDPVVHRGGRNRVTVKTVEPTVP